MKPAALLVQGDTTTVLATALAGFYEQIPIGHVEAGLRTGNMLSPFPEEMNRRLTSPLAHWHFCPTEIGRQNLLNESIQPQTIHVTGNTAIDALLWVRRLTRISEPAFVQGMGIPVAFWEKFMSKPNSRWVLITAHRRESFGNGLERLCQAITKLADYYPEVGFLFPVHPNPNVREPIHYWLGRLPSVALISPLDYSQFVWLMDRCTFLLSDSGGVQEEAPSLGKPVLVTRDTTERPEGVTAGTCRLVGTDIDRILKESRLLLDDPDEYRARSAVANPYGDGHAAARIRKQLEADL
jgi:UDP-N-acetylglucosamine 2-epimerase (non-hydrolysing)